MTLPLLKRRNYDRIAFIQHNTLGLWAGVALFLMILGALGVNLLPSAYFGLIESFSTFAAVGFNAVLGIYLYNDFSGKTTRRTHDGNSN